MEVIRRLYRFLCRPSEPCHRCHRQQDTMGTQFATEYRVFCGECYRSVLGLRSVMAYRR